MTEPSGSSGGNRAETTPAPVRRKPHLAAWFGQLTSSAARCRSRGR
ncbi:hypothetical protein ACFPRL_05100 [Pseudoclavibacter helvolus]